MAYCSWCVVQIGEVLGDGNSFGNGAYVDARSMNSFQIVAGNVGPETEMPCTESIGISPFGYPIQIVASSPGTKPENQASAKLSVVPVLPPEVLPKYAPTPVPWVMFSSRMRTTSAATQ